MKKCDYCSIVMNALIEKLYNEMRKQDESGYPVSNNKIVNACLDAVIVARSDYIFYNSTEKMREVDA